MKNDGGIFHASQRDGVAYRTAKVWEMILANANAGCGICFYLLISYASYIATEGYGIAVATAGMILTVMRVFDGVTDTLIAALFEKMQMKKGKIRFFVELGWIVESLGVLSMFCWASGKYHGVMGVIVFVISYLVYVIGYTFNGIGGSVISNAITNDPTQRPMNGLLSTLYSYLTPLIFNNVVTFMILPKYDNQYNAAMLKELCILYVVVSGIFALMTCIGVRRVDVDAVFASFEVKEEKQKITFSDMVSVLKDNKETRMYMLTCISDKIAQQIGSQSVVTTLLSGVLIGSYAAATMIGNFTMIIGIFFAFSGGIFIAKWGSKKATSIWSMIAIAVAAVSICFCIYLGPNGMQKIGVFGISMIIYAILQLAITGAKMVLTTAGGTMRADVIDYEYVRSGNYMPAIIGGVYSLFDKLITSFSSLIAALCITVIGYHNTVPQMGDKASWPVLIMTVFLYFGLPILGWICNVLAMHFYSLDREKMICVQKTIAEKKGEMV